MTQQDDARLHVAGATIRPDTPFATLDVPVRHDDPSEAFVRKWVVPFYMLTERDEFLRALRPVYHEIDGTLVSELLSYFNWRMRKVGGLFVAAKRLARFEGQVGRLLLRSDVCYAGGTYCAALARLNTSAASDFLREYLDYYLTRKDLWFDQDTAMSALAYLDRANGTNLRADYLALWQEFVANKPAWDLARSDERFDAYMATIAAADALL